VKLGQRMVRLEDGQQGVVAQNGPELRIIYIDRGEERIALKSEKWAPDELTPGPLLHAERYIIAAYADRALRAYERNEPHRTWETVRESYEPYDRGLMRVIMDYLSARETRPAS
jgi:hypothetical protein